MLSAGKEGFTWFHFVTLPVAAGSHMVLSSSTVRHLRNALSLLATTVRASFATTISWYSMPLASQAAFSSSLIGREAFDSWVWPSQNFLKPPPVPDVPTVMLTPVFSVMNSSAAADVSGPTVLDPSEAMAPLRAAPLPAEPSVPLPVACPPHADRASAPATARVAGAPKRWIFTVSTSRGQGSGR